MLEFAVLPALLGLFLGAVPAAASIKAGRQTNAIVVLLASAAAPFVVFLALTPSPQNAYWTAGLMQIVASWAAAFAAPVLCWFYLLSVDGLKQRPTGSENTGAVTKDESDV